MLSALVALAFLSILGGLVGVPYALGKFFHLPNFFEEWLAPVFAAGHAAAEHGEIHVAEYILMALSVSLAGFSIFLAIQLYVRRREIPARFVARYPRLYQLVLNKYYVDEIYQAVFVNNLLRLNRLMAAFDDKVIDGLVNLTGTITRITSKVSGFFDNTFVDGLVNLVATVIFFMGGRLRKIQTGRIQNYLYVAMAGVLIFMIWKMF